MSSFILTNSLNMSHEYIKKVVKNGDVVVDCTAGNGKDTLFLAKLAGYSGKVYAFDVQDMALKNTKNLLIKEGLLHRVKLIKSGHENIDNYVKFPIKAAMFNLGYLPGGDHSIQTKGETTEIAIKKLMDLLVVGGIISIVLYYGGDSGFEEKKHVLDFIKTINPKEFSVLVSNFVNRPNCPPIFICIEKIKETEK